MVRKTRAQIKAAVKETVGVAVREAIAEEAIGERVPGKVIRGVKTPWMARDIEKIFPICVFTPGDTLPVTYNGVRYQLIQGVEMEVPTIIRDTYLDAMKRKAKAGRALPEVGFETTIGLGQGPLPPE